MFSSNEDHQGKKKTTFTFIFVVPYLDHITCLWPDYHFWSFASVSLMLTLVKCKFEQVVLTYLGKWVAQGQICPVAAKVQVILDYPASTLWAPYIFVDGWVLSCILQKLLWYSHSFEELSVILFSGQKNGSLLLHLPKPSSAVPLCSLPQTSCAISSWRWMPVHLVWAQCSRRMRGETLTSDLLPLKKVEKAPDVSKFASATKCRVVFSAFELY